MAGVPEIFPAVHAELSSGDVRFRDHKALPPALWNPVIVCGFFL
jgi:hypothetical protein